MVSPQASTRAPRFYAMHYPPGVTARPGGMEVSDDEAAAIDEDTSIARVAHVSDPDHQTALLGLLRAQLEHVRQWDAQEGAYRLNIEINGSLDPLYAKRADGAVIYHALPIIRDGTAAGASLIRQVYGPQFGLYRHPRLGPLYRTQRSPGTLDRLGRMALPSTPTGRALISARTALGISTLLAPRLAGKAFFLDPDANPQLPVIGRMWGIRNLSLAAGMYAATGANRAQWWRLQPAVDALDFLAIATEWRRGTVPGPAAGLMAATALAATTLGALSVAGESEQRG